MIVMLLKVIFSGLITSEMHSIGFSENFPRLYLHLYYCIHLQVNGRLYLYLIQRAKTVTYSVCFCHRAVNSVLSAFFFPFISWSHL